MQTLHSYNRGQSHNRDQSQPTIPECQEPCKSILGTVQSINEYTKNFSGVLPMFFVDRKAVDEAIQSFARLLINN